MYKLYPASQKFRVCSGVCSFYATAKQIRSGLGDFSKFNDAVQKSLCALEGMRGEAVGLAGTWEGIQVQIDVA